MSKEILKAMLDALSEEIEDCRRTLDDCCDDENLKEEWQVKILKACALIVDVNNEFAVDYSKEISRQKFYEEVLDRFNKQT